LIPWFTPAPWKTLECQIDLRPGGQFFTRMESPDGKKIDNHGCYLVVEPKKLLIFTDTQLEGFRPSGNDFSTIGLSFEPISPTRTMYRALAKHKDQSTKEQHESMGFEKGWGIALDQLIAWVKKT